MTMNALAEKRKVCFFLPSLSGGGTERVVVNLAGQFAKNGYPVDIVLWSGDTNSPYSDYMESSVNVVSVRGPQRQYNLILKGIYALYSIRKLVNYINNADPGIIFASGCELPTIMANLLSRHKPPLAVVVHTDPSYSSSLIMQRGSALKVRFFELLKKLFYPRADRVIGVSKGIAEGMLRLGATRPERISWIYNPIVTRALSLKAKEPVSHPWLINHEKPVFVGVGRLAEEKNFALLIDAFKIVADKLDSVLMIMGAGPLLDYLREKTSDFGLSDRVCFTGFLKNPFSVMAHSDVFVLSSDTEALPSAMIEAMACGCQIVSTDCSSGPAEILNNGVCGRIVPVRDKYALADAMLAAIANPVPKTELAERAKMFDEDVIGARYIALAEELMAK
jgi:glycosyltransferase involved in cell wall biosynthesis